MRARLAPAVTPAALPGALPAVLPGTAQGGVSATAAGAAAHRSANLARPAQNARRTQPGTPSTGPGRQHASTPRATTSRPGPRTTGPRVFATGVEAPAGGGVVSSGVGGGVVGFVLAQVGKAYAFGSVGPEQFDCSGLVAAAYRQIGISLPHQTGALAGVGRPVGRGELRPGDLVFPSTSHVGIYIGGGQMVHASTERGGVKISPIYAFRFARRIG